jgi:hypothetical protein
MSPSPVNLPSVVIEPRIVCGITIEAHSHVGRIQNSNVVPHRSCRWRPAVGVHCGRIKSCLLHKNSANSRSIARTIHVVRRSPKSARSAKCVSQYASRAGQSVVRRSPWVPRVSFSRGACHSSSAEARSKFHVAIGRLLSLALKMWCNRSADLVASKPRLVFVCPFAQQVSCGCHPGRILKMTQDRKMQLRCV